MQTYHNSIVQQPLPLPSVPWWAGLGSQPVYGESFGLIKSISTDQPSGGIGNELAGIPPREESRGDSEKETENASQFTIFPGGGEDRGKEEKEKAEQATLSRQSSQTGYQNCFELGLGQPIVCANYPYIDQYYGVLATYGSPNAGRIMLPLNVKSEDGPIFVNAKQYHGILRRRQSRAKAELENKLVKVRKPYLHESRHLHALRRARGCGGRFLTKNTNNGKGGSVKGKSGKHHHSAPSGSSSSEVLQSDSRNLNAKEMYVRESNLSSSEVTSMYSRGDIDRFHIDHFRSSAYHSLANMIDSGQGMNTSNRWVTAADGCCDLLKV